MIRQPDGAFIRKDIPAEGRMDFPTGSVADTAIAQSDGLCILNGQLGLRMPALTDGKIAEGTRLQGAFLSMVPSGYIQKKLDGFAPAKDAWPAWLGLAGTLPEGLSIAVGAPTPGDYPLPNHCRRGG